MPITKQQSDVPGVSQEEFVKQAQADQDEKRDKELAAAEEGKIPQVSSAPLHNYPQAEYEKAEEEPEKKKGKQPLTGAAAVAEEHPKE